jgi:hypothetical protein
LGPGIEENEEDFYYTEIEETETEYGKELSPNSSPLSSPMIGAEAPTLSHLDMARPATEDPEYLRQINDRRKEKQLIKLNHDIIFGHRDYSCHDVIPETCLTNQRSKVMRVEGKSLLASNSRRRSRGETRKCRKVYGMDSRDSWCTQCKWKKACSRFAD